jgi:hypothetical protein
VARDAEPERGVVDQEQRNAVEGGLHARTNGARPAQTPCSENQRQLVVMLLVSSSSPCPFKQNCFSMLKKSGL